MNVVVMIEGRKAIPVRAIPLLTNWMFFSPDVVAQVLAGEKAQDGFVSGDLQAFHLEDGKVQRLPEVWWRSWAARELRALSEKIKASEPSHEVSYQQWRDESLPLLPAGVFVWKDEFEQFHARNWDSRFRVLSCASSGDDAEERNPSIDPAGASFIKHALASLDKWRELDFSPYIRPALCAVVMEGVASQQATQEVPEAASEAEPENLARAERAAKMAAMLERMASPEFQQAITDAEVIERQMQDARMKLGRAAALLENPSAMGSVKNLKEAEAAVTSRPKTLDEIAERIPVMRGDHTESYPAPPAMTPSPAPVVPANEPLENPWFVINDKDPKPAQPWFTPARYFARQLVIDDSTLLTKRLLLADKVSKSLTAAGIHKRGGKKPLAAGTILKAFVNVALG